MTDHAAEARRRAERRLEWARLADIERSAEEALGGQVLLGDRVMVLVREAAGIARDAVVAAELGWLEVERQDDREAA